MSAETASAPPDDPVATYLRARADGLRAERRWRDAAALYGEAIRHGGSTLELERGCAVCLREAGAFERAERHVRAAQALAPDDAELALERGRCDRARGRLQDAETAFERALALAPDWAAPRAELDALDRAGFVGRARARAATGEARPDPGAIAAAAIALQHRDPSSRLIPEALPRDHADGREDHHERLDIWQIGRRETNGSDTAVTLRGIEAIRGGCISATPLVTIEMRLGDETVWRGAPSGPYPLPGRPDDPRLARYVFNIWFDFAAFRTGRYRLEIVTIDIAGNRRARGEDIAIALSLADTQAPGSDAQLTVEPAAGETLDAAILRLPSMVRPARRRLISDPVTSILVQRLDQLGDLALSLPALRRLRAHFPEARLTGLVSPANADLARTLGVFDAVLVADFPDLPEQGGRTMTATAQGELADALAREAFDIAIDLSENAASRALLRLVRARFRYGFGSRDFPWLDGEVQGYAHDPRNRHEAASHAAKLVALVDWLAAIARDHAVVMRRDDLPRDALDRIGLAPGFRYALLHLGARLPFTRWPHFGALAMRLLDRTSLDLVVIADEPIAPGSFPDSPRLHRLDTRPSFDDLDALVHRCAVFVGNDSGPKHLAALRGVPVVGIHMARNNWAEWGQDGSGVIVSRRVPCAGCLIQRAPETCGRDLACLTGIAPETVLDAVLGMLA